MRRGWPDLLLPLPNLALLVYLWRLSPHRPYRCFPALISNPRYWTFNSGRFHPMPLVFRALNSRVHYSRLNNDWPSHVTLSSSRPFNDRPVHLPAHTGSRIDSFPPANNVAQRWPVVGAVYRKVASQRCASSSRSFRQTIGPDRSHWLNNAA